VADEMNPTAEAVATDAEAKDSREAKNKADREIKEVRAGDLEPYTGLRYLSKLFRFMAVILVMLLIAEVATGIYTQGSAAVPTLLGEASRLIVLAGVLWGTGDLAHLLIDVGHDVRAARILVARVAHNGKAPAPAARSARGEAPFADRPVQRSVSPALGEHDDLPNPPIP
jgi:hypothetical protein